MRSGATPGSSTARRRTIISVALAAALLVAIAIGYRTFAGSHRSREKLEMIPIPSSSIAAVALAGDLVALLAGDERAKGVYVVDVVHKTVIKSFGVPREATQIAAASDQGPLLLSVANNSQNAAAGTIERWTVDGTKTGELPLPGQGLGVTQPIDGIAYALVGRGSGRAAVPIKVWSLSLQPAVPLPQKVERLALCRLSPLHPSLVYSTASRHIGMREIGTHAQIESTAVAEDPVCVADRPAVFAISRTPNAASAVVLTMPALAQVTAIPVSNTAVSLFDAGDRRLGTVNSTNQVGTLALLPQSALNFTTGIESASR
jgi:hypothetical protein